MLISAKEGYIPGFSRIKIVSITPKKIQATRLSRTDVARKPINITAVDETTQISIFKAKNQVERSSNYGQPSPLITNKNRGYILNWTDNTSHRIMESAYRYMTPEL